MRVEDVKFRYRVVFDNIRDLDKFSFGKSSDDYDRVARIMCHWCEQNFGEQGHQWDYMLDKAGFMDHEDVFMFLKEQQRALFLLKWS